MTALIELGVRQGKVLTTGADLKAGTEPFKVLENHIKTGRCGLFCAKGVNVEHLYVVLTQDCTISSGKPVELAPMKLKKVKDEGKIEHLLLGKDYSKLYLRFGEQFYEVEESLLTKLESQTLEGIVQDSTLTVVGELDINEQRILLDWRLGSYLREAFPNGFNASLFEYLSQNKWFSEYLQANRDNIHSLRVFVNPEDDEEADLYHFSITALLTQDGQDFQDGITEKMNQMVSEFSTYRNINCLQLDGADLPQIELSDALILALTATLDEFTFANAYEMREFNFQYLCYE
ncbi:hypothetical protein AAEH84_07790 [Shewanella indica]|uniref:hypothetical protein n=1 Tax=Shewanella indica TaxID=768528 RepID=UPI00313D4965